VADTVGVDEDERRARQHEQADQHERTGEQAA